MEWESVWVNKHTMKEKCPVCGKLCCLRGGMTQHLRFHADRGPIPAPEE